MTSETDTIHWSLGWHHLGVISCLMSQSPLAQYGDFIQALKTEETNAPGWITQAFKGQRTSELVALIRDHSAEWRELAWDWSLFNSNTISIKVVRGLGGSYRDIALTLDTLYLPIELFPTELHGHARPTNVTLPPRHVRIYTTFDAADVLIECDKVVTAPGNPSGYRNTIDMKASSATGLGYPTSLGTFEIEAETSWIGTSRVEKRTDSGSVQPKLSVVIGQQEERTFDIDGTILVTPEKVMPAWPCGAFQGTDRTSMGYC